MTEQLPSLFVVLQNGLSCGVCVHKPPYGWRFISHVSSHRNSRRTWPTAEQAVPRWARARDPMLMTRDEFNAKRNGGNDHA